MDLCWRRGGEEASLWVQALRYFAVREDEESRGHVTEILQYIEQKNLLPPLMVLNPFICLARESRNFSILFSNSSSKE